MYKICVFLWKILNISTLFVNLKGTVKIVLIDKAENLLYPLNEQTQYKFYST